MNTTITVREPITIRTLRDLRSIEGKFRARKGDVPGDRLVGGTIGTELVMGKTDGWSDAFRFNAQQYVHGFIDSMPIPGSEDWETFPEKPVLNEAHVGCGLLIDSAFVSDMAERNEPTEERKFSALDLAIAALGNEKVEVGYEDIPEDGEHIVRVTGTRDGVSQDGKPYVIFHLIDDEKRVCWGMYLGLEGKDTLANFVEAISSNNSGCFEGVLKKDAFTAIVTGKQTFRAWTFTKPEDGRVLTYVSSEKYARLLYARGNREASQLLRSQKRADNEALQNAGDYVAR